MTPSAGILASTDDAFKASRLERMVERTTNSYKLYWLRAIVDEVLDGNVSIPFTRLTARMVASSWYPINYYHLSFGIQDQLGRAVAVCRKRLDLPMDAKESLVAAAIESSSDAVVRKCVDDLAKYVPYRLIRLFYEEVGNLRGMPDQLVNAEVLRLNRADPLGSLYVIDKSKTSISVQSDWVTYLSDNRLVVQGWLDMRTVQYLQSRNPSVPAIPSKIHAPQKRDLAAAKRYWSDAMSDHTFACIYTGFTFSQSSFDAFGPMSIDHFIPWSFVLHDEPWNLIPAFRDTNSSKGDRLPSLDRYLDAFCAQQFDALMTIRQKGGHGRILDSYVQMGAEVSSFERNVGSLESFSDCIKKAVVPLHQIALNQGFALWNSTED